MAKLKRHYVDKPWGQFAVPALFGTPDVERLGEIWYQDEDGRDLPLLVKYIFTSEKLSIQVHPDDAQAQASGFARGKAECWYILEAGPDAVIGIGLTEPMTQEAFVAAAKDGTVEQKIDWKPVKRGDFFYIPPGTVHAIGPDIALAEIQQNCDITYRLFDYGRPRELHLDEGAAISHFAPYALPPRTVPLGVTERLLSTDQAPFEVDLVHLDAGASLPGGGAGQRWFLPLAGTGSLDGAPFGAGECWLIEGDVDLRIDQPCDALVARQP